jgi:chromodomain-helicase-DNA-binding protein 4
MLGSRSQLSNQTADEEESEVPENDFMNAFKVATFEFGAEEEKEEEPPEPAIEKPKEFWEQLLMPGYEQLQEDELQALGKGKRARKAVSSTSCKF